MGALRILLLEDEPHDAELIERTIVQGGIGCTVTQVRSELMFLTALEQDTFDLILADYSLPRFDGISALQAAKRRLPKTPVIIISGVIGEDLALATMKIGACNYVLKHELDRLVPVIRRCLEPNDG